MPGLWRALSGHDGKIRVPELGVPIGEIASWTLSRRGDPEKGKDPESDFYDLHAACQWVNATLLNDPEYEKEIVVLLGREKRPVRLDPANEGPRGQMVLQGRSLTMERVQLWDPVRQQRL